jgi:hypothetical protein
MFCWIELLMSASLFLSRLCKSLLKELQRVCVYIIYIYMYYSVLQELALPRWQRTLSIPIHWKLELIRPW